MRRSLCGLFLIVWAIPLFSQAPPQNPPSAQKKSAAPKQLSSAEELQKTIEAAGNDRAALVRNLENFLDKYPQATERPQIYRALVEASLQLNDGAKAATYAERLISLKPEDISMTLLAIQLIEKNGDEASLRRAVNYSSRVVSYIETSGDNDKSPRVSPEEWAAEKKKDESSLYLVRARLESRLRDNAAARKDAETSYSLSANFSAAEKLGELDELDKSYESAIKNYARAFCLLDASARTERRREVRQKLGNVWRLAHGSEN